MKKRITSMLMAVLMLLTVVSATAAAADDGIAPHSEACRFCTNGAIRTTSTTNQVGSSPIRYLTHSINNYLYACPVYATQTLYTKKCTNCGYIYNTWTESGEVVRHNHTGGN